MSDMLPCTQCTGLAAEAAGSVFCLLIQSTAIIREIISKASGIKAPGKLPGASLMTPSSHTAPEVPMCDRVLMPAIPAAAVAGESVPVARAQNGPLIE